MTSARTPRFWLWLRVVLFALTIAAPAARMAVRAAADETLGEKRTLASRPGLPGDLAGFESFPGRFDAWFDDHFGFRGPLVRTYHRLMGRLLRGHNDRVIVGRDGWLFYRLATTAHEDAGPFSLGELLHWQEALENRHAWLAAQGIPLLVVVTPSKGAIYPEQLPDGLPEPEGSRLDQLLSHLRGHASVPVLDLRGALRHARERERVYQKTDYHFDDAGAHVAYEAVLARAGQQLGLPLEAHPRGSFDEFEEAASGGNMAQLMGLADEYSETRLRLEPKVPGDYGVAPPEPGRSSPWVNQVLETGHGPGDAPHVVMFGDSYGTQLAPFMAPHFERAVFFRPEAIDVQSLAHERPQLVINQFAEFKLQRAPAMDSNEVMEWNARRAFDEATPLLTLDAEGIRKHFRLDRDAEWVEGGSAARVRIRDRDARIMLPAFAVPEEGTPIVRLVVHTAEEDTRARLFYGVAGARSFHDGRSRARRIHPGENVLTFAVIDDRFDGQLALLPGGHQGLYDISGFEVRVAPSDSEVR
jgi:alginate O-acetyltransferase complex protein AlgJ